MCLCVNKGVNEVRNNTSESKLVVPSNLGDYVSCFCDLAATSGKPETAFQGQDCCVSLSNHSIMMQIGLDSFELCCVGVLSIPLGELACAATE